MRKIITVIALFLSAPLLAEETQALDCAGQAELVMSLVQSRQEGVPVAEAGATASEALDEIAGAMLADWIYGLPEEQLSEELGQMWQSQCAQMEDQSGN